MAEGFPLSKGPDAFRTISEVAEELDLPQHVLRFWETRFTQIKPMKRGGGRRYYRPDDVELLRGIRRLLYGEGYTIKGVQRILKEQGLRHVAAFGRDGRLDPAPADLEMDDDAVVAAPVTGQGRPDRSAGSESPSVRGERREPVFEARPDRSSPPRPVERSAPPVKAAPEPVPSVSNFPAAPPDEPDSFETYLPPLVAASPLPPERTAVEPGSDDPYRPHRAEPRREARPPASSPPMTDLHPAPGLSEDMAIAPPGLSRDDIDLLQSALVELLECKRLLDQSR